jgi:hypothetical protein
MVCINFFLSKRRALRALPIIVENDVLPRINSCDDFNDSILPASRPTDTAQWLSRGQNTAPVARDDHVSEECEILMTQPETEIYRVCAISMLHPVLQVFDMMS